MADQVPNQSEDQSQNQPENQKPQPPSEHLEELKKELYREKSEFGVRPGAPQAFEPGREAEPISQEVSLGWEKGKVTKIGRLTITAGQKKILKLLALSAMVILVAMALFTFWRTRILFDSKKVFVEVFGPERLVSGESVSYIVRYKNSTYTSLEDVKLTFIYPDGSLPIDDKNLTHIGSQLASVHNLPNLEKGKEGQMEFRANVVGLKDDKKQVVAKLSYRPAKISSSFENSAEFTSLIFALPLVLDFDLPEIVVSGQEVQIFLKYLNTSDITFSDLVLRVDYPQGFTFNSSLPNPSESSATWLLTEIGPREEGKVIISGVLIGAKNEVKTFKGKIEMIKESSSQVVSQGLASTLVSVSPLSVELKVNDQRDYLANPGERLDYELTYQNTVDVPITSVFIILKFDTKVLDFSSLRIEKGFFNNLENSITWNEASLSDLRILQPGEKKTIGFFLNVKDRLPIANFNDKNFLIVSEAKIDSSNVPISLRGTQLAGTDTLSLKLNSKLIISTKGFYQDSLMPNSGPLPPRVGQLTTYTIYWRVINLANDVDEVTVESYLPPYVRWLNKFEPQDANVKYDSNTGKTSWSLGRLAANTGILSPVKQLVFQIGLLPASNQVGTSVGLVQKALISGKDLFTQSLIEGTAESVESTLPDDPSVGYQNGIVTD